MFSESKDLSIEALNLFRFINPLLELSWPNDLLEEAIERLDANERTDEVGLSRDVPR